MIRLFLVAFCFAGAVFAAVNAFQVSARNIATDADEITGLEFVHTGADRFNLATDLVEDEGGPFLDAGQADAINDDVRLADGSATRAHQNFTGTGSRQCFLNGAKCAAGFIEIVRDRFQAGRD